MSADATNSLGYGPLTFFPRGFDQLFLSALVSSQGVEDSTDPG